MKNGLTVISDGNFHGTKVLTPGGEIIPVTDFKIEGNVKDQFFTITLTAFVHHLKINNIQIDQFNLVDVTDSENIKTRHLKKV